MIKSIDAEALERVRAARAMARERARDAGARPEELILDIDATLLGAHSEKKRAAGTYKNGFGFFPLLCFLEETSERWPEGTRLLVRRERPHPGAQFEVFDAQSYRHTAFITDQEGADIAALELRHRRRAGRRTTLRLPRAWPWAEAPAAAFTRLRALPIASSP